MVEWHQATLDNIEPMPWKNGGGQTRQLVAWPQEADEWAIRVSIADVTQDGPFSSFEGIKRWFGVLSGDGVRLFDEIDICVGEKLYEFDGQLAPSCTLLGEEVRDFNVMYRESDGGELKVSNAQAINSLYAIDARWVGFFTVDGGSLNVNGIDNLSVPPMTLVWAENASVELTFSSHGSGVAYWILLE